MVCFLSECDGLSFDLSSQLWMPEMGVQEFVPRGIASNPSRRTSGDEQCDWEMSLQWVAQLMGTGVGGSPLNLLVSRALHRLLYQENPGEPQRARREIRRR